MAAQAAPALNPRDKQITVEELLSRAASRIDGAFAGQPRVEASIRQTIGEAFYALRNPAAAQEQIERALEIRQDLLGEEHLDALESMVARADKAMYAMKHARSSDRRMPGVR